jgi:predicted membrane channel-forming protein YqfA (hemolysin III family)
MIKKIKNPVLTLLATFVFLGGIHIMLLESILPKNYADFSLLYIYIFLFVISVVGIWGVLMVQKLNKEQMPMALLAYTVIKFLASLVFLLPDLLNQTDFTRPFIYQFFAVFFPILLIESIVFMRIVNDPNTENK